VIPVENLLATASAFHGGLPALDAGELGKPDEGGSPVPDDTITLTISKADAEVLLGVLASERYNAEVEAVCDSVRRQLDERLAELG
jgi:hypothetical protein